MDTAPPEQWHVVATLPPQQPLPPARRQHGTTPRRLAVVAAASLVGSLALVGVIRAVAPPPGPQDVQRGGLVEIPGGSYSFASVHGDALPVRWNPCEPIRYVTNLSEAPATAETDLTEALQRVTAATGIRFISDGETDELPVRHRDAYQPDRYGDTWAPMLVAWSDLPSTGLDHTDETVGVGTPLAVSRGGSAPTYVSAQVALTTGRDLEPGFDSPGAWGAILMHEIAHVIGLGHSPEPAEVMFEGSPPPGGPVTWGRGDLEGLRLLGTEAGCLPTPRASDVD